MAPRARRSHALAPWPRGSHPVASRPGGSRALASWAGSGGAQDLRDGLAVRGAGGVLVPGRADQAARGVQVRGVQHGRAGRTRSAVPRATAVRGSVAGPSSVRILTGSHLISSSRPVVLVRRRGLRSGALPRPGGEPPDGEQHQDHQAEGDSGHDHVKPYPDQAIRRDRRVPGDVPHDHARGHQEGTDHDRRGSRDRQDDDEPHPPGRGGVGAHWSTIASRLPARKPYGQL
jgi:hypothetical protein